MKGRTMKDRTMKDRTIKNRTMTMKDRTRKERGTALIWAMLLLIAFASFSASILRRGRDVRSSGEVDRARMVAYHAALGGLAYARFAIAENPAFRSRTISLNGCRVELRVEPTGREWRAEIRARPGGVVIEAYLARRRGLELPAISGWKRRG